MKRIWFTLIILALLLSACGSTNATSTAQDTTSSDTTTVEEGTPTNGDFPEIAKILLGSFLLENTDYAITSEQASTLLPLWKGLNALLSSDTITDTELNGLYKQIENAMTKDQLAQIDSMDINQESMRTVMDQIGLGGGQGGPGQGGPGGNSGDLTEEQVATLQAEREANGGNFPGGGQGGGPGDGGMPGGDMAGGGMPGGNGDAGMMMGQGSTDSSGTVMPEQAGDPTLRLMSSLIQPLMELLQTKIDG